MSYTGYSFEMGVLPLYRDVISVFYNPSWLVGLVSLFNGISTLFRLFNAKAILLEEQYYLTHSWEDKEVHIFPKGICPKVNIIAWLENELAYYDSVVHRFNHYTTRTTPTPQLTGLGALESLIDITPKSIVSTS